MKNKKVVIFGNQAASSLIYYCLTHDSSFEVAGFTVDQRFIHESKFEGLPLVPFEELEAHFPPDECDLINPIGYHEINGVRKEKFLQAKARGYNHINYISSRASVWPDLKLGENVIIYEHAIIQPFASIGDNCIIRSGCHISHHCLLGSHVFVAAGVTTGGKVSIGDQAFLGVGSVIVDSLTIAPRSFVGAGAVVTKSTFEDRVYVGNPAKTLEKTSLEVTGYKNA